MHKLNFNLVKYGMWNIIIDLDPKTEKIFCDSSNKISLCSLLANILKNNGGASIQIGNLLTLNQDERVQAWIALGMAVDDQTLSDVSTLTKNELAQIIIQKVNSIENPSPELKNIYAKYQSMLTRTKNENFNDTISELRRFIDKYKEISVYQNSIEVLTSGLKDIRNLFLNKTYLDSDFTRELALFKLQLLFKAYQALINDPKLQTFWSKLKHNDFVKELNQFFKRILESQTRESRDPEIAKGIKSDNFIKMCYKFLKEYNLNVGKHLIINDSTAKVLWEIVNTVDNPENIQEFLINHGCLFTINEFANKSKGNTFIVLTTSELSSVLSDEQLIQLLNTHNWEEDETFRILQNLLSHRQVTKIQDLRTLNYAAIEKFTLTIDHKKATTSLYIYKDLMAFVFASIDDSKLLVFFQKIKDFDFDIFYSYPNFVTKIKEKAIGGDANFQLLLSEIYANNPNPNENDIVKACSFLKNLVEKGYKNAFPILEKLTFSIRGFDCAEYTLGEIYLEQQEFVKARKHYANITDNSQYYQAAQTALSSIPYISAASRAKEGSFCTMKSGTSHLAFFGRQKTESASTVKFETTVTQAQMTAKP